MSRYGSAHQYISTRQPKPATPTSRKGIFTHHFTDIVLKGLADDGGLYIPYSFPDIQDELHTWQNLSYAELAAKVMGIFIDDIPQKDLLALCKKTYTAEHFKYCREDEDASQITPLRHLGEFKKTPICLLSVSNGPTLAFKDMAMQFLGNLFEYILERKQTSMTIIGATSGDTGAAAEYAMRGKKNIELFMLSPHGKMSPFQQAQMYHLQEKNIHNMTVEGFFHHCQDLVKSLSGMHAFRKRTNLSTVNSINWARILAQVVYYVHAYLLASKKFDLGFVEPIDICVPSGNFGNICAAYIAKKMGVPIRQLICATNENDILAEFFTTGVYRVRGEADTTQTSSPSMDIAKSSNLERLIFDALRQSLPTSESFELTTKYFSSDVFDIKEQPAAWQFIQDQGFIGKSSNHDARIKMIRYFAKHYNVSIDPHTADGAFAALAVLEDAQKNTKNTKTSKNKHNDHNDHGVPMVIVETAQGTKFEDTMLEALKTKPIRHKDFANIENLPKKFDFIANDVLVLKRYINKKLREAKPKI